MFTLGRDIDIHYPTNRLILILAALSGLIGVFFFNDWLTGVKIAGAIFMSWAMSRETDPKREYGAFVSVAIAIILIIFTDIFQITFLELLFVMLILRFINTTSGDQPTFFDAGIILVLASFLSYIDKSLVYLALYLIGFFLSPIFKEKKVLKIITSLLATLSAVYLIYLLLSQGSLTNPLIGPLSLLSQVLLYSLFSIRDRKKKIYDDAGSLVDSSKILKAQIFLLVIISVFLFLTNPAIGNIIIYYATTMGVALYGFIFHIKDK